MYGSKLAEGRPTSLGHTNNVCWEITQTAVGWEEEVWKIPRDLLLLCRLSHVWQNKNRFLNAYECSNSRQVWFYISGMRIKVHGKIPRMKAPWCNSHSYASAQNWSMHFENQPVAFSPSIVLPLGVTWGGYRRQVSAFFLKTATALPITSHRTVFISPIAPL